MGDINQFLSLFVQKVDPDGFDIDHLHHLIQTLVENLIQVNGLVNGLADGIKNRKFLIEPSDLFSFLSSFPSHLLLHQNQSIDVLKLLLTSHHFNRKSVLPCRGKDI